MKARFSEGWRVREGLCSFRMMGDTPAPPNSTALSSALSVPLPRSSMKPSPPQPSTPCLGPHLQHRPPSAGSRLPHSSTQFFSRSHSLGPLVSRICRTSTRASPFTADLVILLFCDLQLKRRFSVARKCDLCGKGPQFGNNVSHANNITLRRWNPNLHHVRAVIDGVRKRVRVCTSCLRSGKVVKPA